jgi:hypothetical protein
MLEQWHNCYTKTIQHTCRLSTNFEDTMQSYILFSHILNILKVDIDCDSQISLSLILIVFINRDDLILMVWLVK